MVGPVIILGEKEGDICSMEFDWQCEKPGRFLEAWDGFSFEFLCKAKDAA